MTERVPLNLRVPINAKAKFERAVRGKFGCKDSYAGHELEREFRAILDDGRYANLRAAVQGVADAFGEADRKEKTHAQGGSETAVTRYQIHEDVREEIVSLATCEDYRSAGEFVGAVMLTYAEQGGTVGRLIDKLDRVRQVAEREIDASADPKVRRTETLADELGGGDSFTMSDFDQAVDEAARGIDSGRYAREEYLPRVLDELGYTWHPNNETVFVDPSVLDLSEHRDPTAKPYILMDRADKRDALKFAAYRNAVETPTNPVRFSVSDAVDTLGGRPRRNTARSLLSDVAEGAPGFEYTDRQDEPVLVVNRRDVEAATDANRDILQFAGSEADESPSNCGGSTGEDTTPDSDSSASGDGWVRSAADRIDAPLSDVPDAVITNAIAKERYPDEVSDGVVSDDAQERVAAADVERVRDQGADETERIRAELDALTDQAEPAMTDGGRPVSD